MSFLSAVGAAFWLGLLTAMSPCLLATNVAAISFLARRAGQLRFVLLSSGCYIAGQALAFVGLAMIISQSLVSIPVLSHVLQKYMFRLLGPVLILCALLLLQWITFQLGGGRVKGWVQERAHRGGQLAALSLGLVFAMSFCPTTAALYFGGLMPLVVSWKSTMLLPAAYALGVALPVALFTVLIAVFTHQVSRAFQQVGRVERLARLATGSIFLAVGVYFTLRYTLELV